MEMPALKWKHIDYTPAGGKIYSKGDRQMVIYLNGEKKLWAPWPNGSFIFRNKNGKDNIRSNRL